MSFLFWLLLLVAPAAAIYYVVWAHRQKATAREASSRERYAALVGATRGAAGAAAAPRTESAAPAAIGPSVPAAPAAKAGERFLTRPETLLFYVLRAGLPGHEIFPRVTLASVLDVGAAGAALPVRPELDFLVCDKSMRPVAAVLLDGQAGAAAAEATRRALHAAGIRLVRLDPAAPPRREQVRALVLGHVDSI